MFKMKRLLSLFLCLLMIIGCFAGCKKKAVPTVASGEQITRGAWVKLLADSFYFNSTTEKPYFSDIAKDNELFNAVQACVDLGIIENEDTFNMDNAVTYKEIALNTVNTIGISTVQDYLKTDKKLSEKKLLKFATDKGIVKSASEKFATTTDAETAVKTAVTLYVNKPLVEKEKIELSDDITDLKDKKITVANDSFTYEKADTLKVGDIIILPPTEEYVSGVARKVESVSGNTVKTTTPKLEEVYETIQLSSITVPKVSDIKASNDGVTFENYSEIELTSAKSKPQVTTLALNSNNNGDVFLLGNKGASFNVNINITKGKLSIDEGWNSLSGSFSEQDIKNNYFQYKVDKNGNLYTSKYNSGYEIKGKISISDLSLTNDIDFGLIQGLKKAETKVNFKASVNLSVKGKINETIDVFTTSIPIGTTGLWVDAVFSLVFDSNGDVSVKCTLENTTTYTYEKGLKTANDTKLNNKAAISGNLSAKVGPRAVLVALGIDLFDIQAMIGLASKAEVSAEQGTTEIPCVDVKVYAPTLSIAFAGDKNTLLNQLGFNATWKVYDIDGGWQKPLTTLTYHYEAKNGWVNKCTHPKKVESDSTSSKPTTSSKPSASSQPSTSGGSTSSSNVVSSSNTEPTQSTPIKLTTENINDISKIDAFAKNSDRALFTVKNTEGLFAFIQYLYNGKEYICEKDEFRMFIALLNSNYINEKALVEMFSDKSLDDIKRFSKVVGSMCGLTVRNKAEIHYDNFIVDNNKKAFLKNLESSSRNVNDMLNFIRSFYSGTNKYFNYGDDVVIDYYVYMFASVAGSCYNNDELNNIYIDYVDSYVNFNGHIEDFYTKSRA